MDDAEIRRCSVNCLFTDHARKEMGTEPRGRIRVEEALQVLDTGEIIEEYSGDSSLFLFHENWTSEDDLKRHFETPHITRWIQEAKGLLAEPMELTRWQKVD